MNQDTLNKIKSYKNSKYVWCAVGGVAGFLIGIYRAALFKVLIFCVVCAVGVILFAIFSKIVNKIYQKRMEAKNNAYGFDYLAGKLKNFVLKKYLRLQISIFLPTCF